MTVHLSKFFRIKLIPDPVVCLQSQHVVSRDASPHGLR